MSELKGTEPERAELERAELKEAGADDEEPSRGPNLVLLYSLIGLALLAAIFIAGLIVLPFYRRR
jgi:hypothetical protein